jgi:uncharacterized protein YjiS (DUF1127 family)
MATYQNTNVQPFGSNLFAGITNVVENVVANVTAWNAARATKAELSALSARELADIGLTRGDINNI